MDAQNFECDSCEPLCSGPPGELCSCAAGFGWSIVRVHAHSAAVLADESRGSKTPSGSKKELGNFGTNSSLGSGNMSNASSGAGNTFAWRGARREKTKRRSSSQLVLPPPDPNCVKHR